jgi:osmoprotectant transport system permease protein
MAVTTPDRVPAPAAPADSAQVVARRAARYLAMPAFLTAVCVLLYLYVDAQELDSIAARRLNAEVIVRSTVRHLQLVGLSTAIVILLAVPLGVLLTRSFARSITPPLITVANTGQAIPSVGVIVLLALTLGFGFRYAIVALVLYAFLPVLRNTMVGLQQVDRTIIEAGRGMGMTRRGVLLKIELPLAVPVVLAGVRTALVINVGTAAIAAITNAGGLGDIIYAGLVTNRTVVTLTGGVLTAVLALLVDWTAGIAEEWLRPRGL